MVRTYNLSVQEAEARVSQVQGQSQEFNESLSQNKKGYGHSSVVQYLRVQSPLQKEKEKSVSLQNVLDEIVKIITLWINDFLIFCVTKQELCTKHSAAY